MHPIIVPAWKGRTDDGLARKNSAIKTSGCGHIMEANMGSSSSVLNLSFIVPSSVSILSVYFNTVPLRTFVRRNFEVSSDIKKLSATQPWTL